MAYTVKNDGFIPEQQTPTIPYNGSQFLVIHSTSDLQATAANEDQFFDNNWDKVYAYVQWAIDDKEAWNNYPDGMKAWGAGNVNPYAYSQIEICEFNDDNRSKAAIANAVQLAKAILNEAKQKGINIRIVSHHEAQSMFGGSDHTDPDEYFARFGYNMDWFRQQVGVASAGSTSGGSSSASNGSSSGSGYIVSPYNRLQSVDINGLNIRTSQNSSSASIGTLGKGATFNATRICKNGEPVTRDGKSYSTWFEVNGRGWASGAWTTEVKSASGGPGLTVDGIMGTNTIKALQSVMGVTSDGILGPITIKTLQAFLNKHTGFALAIDGIMGKQTITALQKYLGTPQDGVISSPSTMVKTLQLHLNNGYL